ncbi:TPA: restriction endonuclease subunit S [Acinetobacter baumannii]
MATPKLRFKGFEGDWSIKSLSELANLTSSKRVHLSDYVRDGIPFFRGKEITELKSGVFPTDILYISHNQFNEFKEKYGVPKNNDILITAVGTLANTYLVNTNYDFYFKDGNLIWLKDIKADPKFLMILLDAKKNDVLASAIGSTQKALTIANLNKLVFNFPCNLEQTKIASFLSAVDEKISLLTRKHELLSQYKQGVMQKLFSQEIRFKADDGSEFEEWEKTILGKIGIFLKGKGISKADIVQNGATPCIRYGELYTQYGEVISNVISATNLEVNSLVLSKANDVLIPASGETQIDIATASCVLQSEVALSGDLNIFRTEENGVFLSYLIRSHLKMQIAQLAQGNSVVHLYSSQLKGVQLNLPCLEEQTKIANFLSAIDQKIEVVAQQIEQAKEWKKGLLQQMFV